MTRTSRGRAWARSAALLLVAACCGCGGGGGGGDEPPGQVFSYDALGRLTSVEYPDGSTVTYSYDAGGNLVGCTQVPGD